MVAGFLSTAALAQTVQQDQQRDVNQQQRIENGLQSGGVVGNPNSASSRRMQADVQRNVNQQQRVAQGWRSAGPAISRAGSQQGWRSEGPVVSRAGDQKGR